MDNIKERARKISNELGRINYTLKYCENFIKEWEQATDQIKHQVRNAWRFEKSHKDSDLVSDFDNFDVRR